MLRTKKKQLNLKPNRVLDKRSSRGMLYENEELRLRTIHINDEVEKGHHDIKKLRKENEYLKREIWSLRDECEKLEEVLKKVYSGDPPPPEDLPTYQPHRRKHSAGSTSWNRRESSLHLSNYGEDYDDNDEEEYGEEQEEGEICGDLADEEVSTDPPEMTTSGESDNHAGSYEPYSPLQPFNPDENQMTEMSSSEEYVTGMEGGGYWVENAGAAELEVLREENEFSSVQSVVEEGTRGLMSTAAAACKDAPLLYLPSDDELTASGRGDNADGEEKSKESVYPGCDLRERSGFKPEIEITPASSQSSATCLRMECDDESELAGGEAIKESGGKGSGKLEERQVVHELGCVTVVGKKYQVTSELKIGPVDLIPRTESPESLLPQNSQKRHKRPPVKSCKTDNSSGRRADLKETKYCEYYPGSGRVQSFHSDSLGKFCNLEDKAILPYYQSEPSLSSSPSVVQAEPYHLTQRAPVPDREWAPGSGREGKKSRILSLPKAGFHGQDNSVGMCSVSSCEFDAGTRLSAGGIMGTGSWNCVDRNVVIGFLDEHWRSSEEELRAQEVIDELEAQFDPSLEKIAGVRMLVSAGGGGRSHGNGNRIFISLREEGEVRAFIEKGLSLRGRQVKLVDANSSPTISIILSGLPSSVPDALVISVLNQFGQVVAPLERRVYKGVDISERFAKMHLVKSFPTHALQIGGYETIGKIVTKAESMAPSLTVTNYVEAGTRSHQDLFRPDEDESSLPQQSCHQSMLPASSASLPSIRAHKAVIRSATLDCPTSLTPNPHQCISGNFGPTAAAVQKRKMSICSAIIDGNGNSGGGGGQRVGVAMGGKKGVQRMSSIKPPAPATPIVLPHVEVSQEESSRGGRQLAVRSLSFDPRKISATKAPAGIGSEQSLTDSIPSQGGRRSSIRGIPISRQPSRIYGGQRGSSFRGTNNNNNNNNNIVTLDKKEPLPWCGCWGNGCV